ncbi:MAG: hypothetical protein BJ554DRAFT_285, partial [Olpidium bornovanus]
MDTARARCGTPDRRNSPRPPPSPPPPQSPRSSQSPPPPPPPPPPPRRRRRRPPDARRPSAPPAAAAARGPTARPPAPSLAEEAGGRLFDAGDEAGRAEQAGGGAEEDDYEDAETSADRLKRDLEDTREHGDAENLTRRHNLGRFRSDPVGFMMRLTAETSAFWQGTDWRSYANYIGARILYNGYTAEVQHAVLSSERVTQTITALAARQAEQLLPILAPADVPAGPMGPTVSALLHDRRESLLQKKRVALEQELRGLAKTYTHNLVANMDSPRRVRFAAFVINNILARMYHQGIYIKESEFLEVGCSG